MIVPLLRGFCRTRAIDRRMASRAQLVRWQERKLRSFLDRHASRAPAFADMVGKPLDRFPVMDKADLMAGFERYNAAGITTAAAWAAFEAGERVAGHAVGASTGTSGNRGLYIVNDAERFEWLGVMLAKTLSDAWRRRHRVAIMLPANSSLYDAAEESGWLSLRFFDLRAGVRAHEQALIEYRPTCVVAPPKALVALTETAAGFAPDRLYSAGEVLDAADRRMVEERFGSLGEIYMATEGLLGTTCRHGTLHLAEDLIHFEYEPVGGLVAPIITDFSRRSQMMVRYRMNDLLALSDQRCPCGSFMQGVSEIAGRVDDAFLLPGESGDVLVTPDVIRNAVVGADRSITDYRVRQTGPDAVTLTIPPAMAGASEAQQSLCALFAGFGCSPTIDLRREPVVPPQGRKLRRVERCWTEAS